MKNTNAETRETLQELYKEFKGDEVLAATMKVPEKKKVDKLNAVSRQRATQLPVRPACPSRPLRGVLGEGARWGPGICLEGGGRDPPLGGPEAAALRPQEAEGGRHVCWGPHRVCISPWPELGSPELICWVDLCLVTT